HAVRRAKCHATDTTANVNLHQVGYHFRIDCAALCGVTAECLEWEFLEHASHGQTPIRAQILVRAVVLPRVGRVPHEELLFGDDWGPRRNLDTERLKSVVPIETTVTHD